jgi:hypothetical protein
MRRPPRKIARHGVKPATPEAAFDVWLNRSLHQMFDEVAHEPVPDVLLKLIEEDREK